MAAFRSLAGCLVLWLLVSGCEIPALRWNRFQRDLPTALDEGDPEGPSRESHIEADEAPWPRLEREVTELPESEAPPPGELQTPDTPRIPEEFLERYASVEEPGAPEIVMEVPPIDRAVALSGEIDEIEDPVTPAPELLAGYSQPPSEVPVVTPADVAANEQLSSAPPSTGAPSGATEPADDSSPWGLPRIPDVLGMSRPAPEEPPSSTDWTFGIGQRLIPGSRAAEAPVHSASLPESLPAGSAVWNGSSAYSREELSKLISLLEAELAGVAPATESERRDFLRRHVLLRNLYLLAGRPHDAQQAVPSIDPADQEFWTELNWAMASYFDEEMLPSRSDRAAQAVTRLSSAQRALEPLVPLEIRNLHFCRQIHGFGDYETFGVNEFTAGQQLLLYTEVRHFQSESDPSGVYRTLLESEIAIYSEGATRELIDRTVFPSTEDLCRTRRSDYFHSYRIDLPASLQPGTYVLELTVEDRLAGKSATDSRRFVIVP
jgi:hypothetical protein